MYYNLEKLIAVNNAFDFNETNDTLFVEAMKENYRHHLTREPYLKYSSDKNNVSPDDINTLADIYKIPPLFVGTMKINSFASVPPEEIALTLTSSGTKGQKTQILLDADSLRRIEILAENTFISLGYKKEKPVHYIIMAYDRKNAKDVGTSWSDEQMLKFAEAKSIHWAIDYNEATKEFHFDINRIAKLFIELATDAPVRLLGFPAFIYQMVEEVTKIKPDLAVDPESFVLAGGGWKNHLGVVMTHQSFAEYLYQKIALPKENIRDVYGMVEHGVPYGSCSEGVHHCPIYARIAAVDPLTLEHKNYGEEGLLALYTPYNTALSNLAILSTDIVTIKNNCKCGIKGDYIASIRRGGITKHRGCAIAAQEILDKSNKK